MKYILLVLALIALRSPLSAQKSTTELVPLLNQSVKQKEAVKQFFVHSNAKDLDKYTALFADQVAQYFLVANTSRQTVYSKAWAWFKAHPDEHYAPHWDTFSTKGDQAEITIEYYRDGVPIKPYRMLFGFDGGAIDGVTMHTL